MDKDIKLINPNPKNGANLLSKLFFTWIIKTYKKVLKSKDFHVSDLYKVLSSHSSENLGNEIEDNWRKEVLKSKVKQQKPSLFKVIISTFSKEYMIYGGILFLQHIILRPLQPVLLAHLLRLFGQNSNKNNEMYICVSLLVLVTFLVVLTMHHANFGQAAVGMKIRIAISSLMYRKTLKLNRKALNQTSVGQIINLLSNDLTRFDLVVLALHYLWILPFQVIVVTFLCWMEFGASSFIGVLSIAILSIPFQGYLGKLTSIFRSRMAEKTDERVTLMSEIISGIQAIKMYAWEKPFELLVQSTRKQEIKALAVTSYLRGIYMSFIIFVERTALFLTLVYYILLGNIFTAEQVFSTSQFFNLLQLTMSIFYPLSISYGAEALVAIQRIEKFLLMDENENVEEVTNHKGVIFDKVCAGWSPHEAFLHDVTFKVPEGSLCAIVGPVGSGKSSLLQLILKELTPEHGTVKVSNSISYASQEPWLYPATIRNNILFGKQYNKKFYNKVVQVCALEKDFRQFSHADKTLVGERGASLSGGQRARINLARAIYTQAEIYLLDDPLSAVDTQVAKHLFEECIVKYLKHKTRILVTHQLQFLKKVDIIIVVNNGKIEAKGSYNELSKKCLDFTKNEEEEKEEIGDLTESDNSLLESTNFNSEKGEEEESGITKGSESFVQYILSSKSPCLTVFTIISMIFCQALCCAVDYWVTFWTQKQTLTIISTLTALYIYTGLIFSLIFSTFIRSVAYFKLAINISKNLHNTMLNNLLYAKMKFFNLNPSGRVLNRFSKDLGAVDEMLPKALLDALQIVLTMCGILIMVVISNYIMIVVVFFLGFLFMKIRSWFVTTTKYIKHLEGITKSPVFSHLNSSLQGITTIRAFKAEKSLREEFDHYQDIHTSTWFLLITTTSSFGLWLDLVCLTFIACTSFSFVLLNQYDQISASFVGLAISQSLILTGMLQYGVRQNAEVVNQLTSVERILQYKNIEKEAPIVTAPENQPPSSWPNRGFILIDNLSLQYSLDKPPVLKNLNIEIEAGEKIGIVGRTGAGKSSLISALFRLSEISGSIYIDGIDTKLLGISDLRRNLSIIPQEPVLFSTTLRQNLDPLNERKDEAIWKVLEEVDLKDVITHLDVTVRGSGSNFSVGQRQLICLARAILKNNKILIMDEATANTDQKTDAFIQKMVREKFEKCTVLTIAHRLHTVMDSDKILVMENGKIVEFDHPYLLLQKPDSVFAKMVAETGPETSAQLEKTAFDAFLVSKRIK